MRQFAVWLEQAVVAQLREANAMTLATATRDGVPSARIVLLKGVQNGEFVFYTNYESHKGRELALNPKAALVFFWNELERQVRIEGTVEKVAREESEAYFPEAPVHGAGLHSRWSALRYCPDFPICPICPNVPSKSHSRDARGP